MTTSAITRTLNKVERSIESSKSNDFHNVSLGFHRLSCLPVKVRNNYDLSANLDTNFDGLKAINNQIAYLGSLSKDQFVNWLKLA